MPRNGLTVVAPYLWRHKRFATSPPKYLGTPLSPARASAAACTFGLLKRPLQSRPLQANPQEQVASSSLAGDGVAGDGWVWEGIAGEARQLTSRGAGVLAIRYEKGTTAGN